MKKLKFLNLTIAFIMIFSALLLNTKSYATEPKNETAELLTTTSETEEKEEGEKQESAPDIPEIIENDLYVAFGEDDLNATSYNMNKYVDGNVYIIGNDVTISGQINGSLFVLASKVTFTEDAYVVCHTFVVAQEIKMAGVTTDMYAVTNKFDMEAKAIISRDLKLAATDATLLGSVGRDTGITVSNMKVYQDEEVNFFVGRNLEYTSGHEAEHIGDITVRGEVKYSQETETEEVENKTTVSDIIAGALKAVIFVVIIYALAIFLAPKFTEKTREYASTRALLAAAIGLAFTILSVIAIIISLFIEVKVFAVFLFVTIIIWLLNNAIVSIVANECITNKVEALNSKWKKLLMIIPVSLVIYLLEQIPYVGGLVSVVVFFIGVGIVVLYQFDKRKKNSV